MSRRRVRRKMTVGGRATLTHTSRSPHDVTNRLDRLITDIRTRFHKHAMGSGEGACADVLVVAHGHILRAFAMRWIGRNLTEGVSLLLEGIALHLKFGFSANKG